jgi:putative acetyltransferase
MVRDEQIGDVAQIREVNQRAFGQDQEANIVDALRADGAALLSLVATENDQVVGHIMFSAATIGSVTGAALGPMAVHPLHQRQGIGSQLVVAGTRSLQQAGCPFIVVIGHAEFYPRFGFKPASTFDLTCEWDVPDDVFLVLMLDPVRTASLSGMVKYRHEFSTVV